MIGEYRGEERERFNRCAKIGRNLLKWWARTRGNWKWSEIKKYCGRGGGREGSCARGGTDVGTVEDGGTLRDGYIAAAMFMSYFQLVKLLSLRRTVETVCERHR